MYVAGWNLPGCLPEMEPVTFATMEEAYDFIADEQDRVASAFDHEDADDPYVYWVEAAPLDMAKVLDWFDGLEANDV